MLLEDESYVFTWFRKNDLTYYAKIYEPNFNIRKQEFKLCGDMKIHNYYSTETFQYYYSKNYFRFIV